jgi:hypothetical protein
MSKEDLNQNEEAENNDLLNEEENSPKPQDGDDSEDASKQEVSEDTFLARVNKETGKNFKSLDDWKDSLKNLEKAVADKGRNKEKESPKSNTVIKRLYFKEVPEAETVWDDVEKEAKELGVDPFNYYESKKGWQLEAKARFEAQKEEKAAKSKIKNPSNIIGDREIDFAKITPNQISKLSDKEYAKYKEFLKKHSYREGKAITLD